MRERVRDEVCEREDKGMCKECMNENGTMLTCTARMHTMLHTQYFSTYQFYLHQNMDLVVT